MDFEDAAVRLARDQTKARNRSAASSGRRGLGEKAKRQAEYQKKQQEKLRKERERKKRIELYQQKYMTSGARALRERSLGPKNTTTTTTTANPTAMHQKKHRDPLVLQPTSIWGDGDKIALPPSVLETLTAMTLNSGDDGDAGGGDNSSGGGGSGPWTFRIGIPNPDYKFPMSTLVKELTPPEETDGRTIGNGGNGNSNDLDDEDDHGIVAMEEDSDDDEDDDDDDDSRNTWEAYLDELDHKYLSYTHCTVVEFTQEEGFCGIPQPIAEALLDPANSNKKETSGEGGAGHEEKDAEDKQSSSKSVVIRPTKTVDPASVSMKRVAEENTEDGGGIDGENSRQEDDTAMDTTTTTATTTNDDEGDKTPGHLAWGAFDIPDVPGLEITLVKLPKGKGATLVPTPEAVRRNFYGLKDVKLVLEQSLIRTRATLSQGDVVSTWHRGVRFDLKVTNLIPASFRAVLCINTDIEVDIGETKLEDDDTMNPTSTTKPPPPADEPKGFRLGSGGQTLTSPRPAAVAATSKSESEKKRIDLPPEPPADQKEGVCTVQIRHSTGQGKRRFDVSTARVKDLFGFASSLMDNRDVSTFRLVTRFPRREFSLQGDDGGPDGPTGQSTFAEAGIQQGQELFLCENI